MKKRITLKILTVLTVAFFAVNVNAQILTNYVQAVAGEAIDTVTNSSTTRLYVLPDPVFSPSYNATTNANLGTNQRWTWTGASFTKAAANENWIEVDWSTINGAASGTYTSTVVESNTGLSCTDAGIVATVEVVDSSSVTFTPDGAGFFGSDASPYNVCVTDGKITGGDVVQAAFTNADLTAVGPSYQIQYTATIDSTHSNGATWTTIGANTLTYSGAAGTQQAVTGTTHNLSIPTGSLDVVTDGIDYPARYTFTINGVTDRISRKSDYLGNTGKAATGWTWYDTTAETVVIVVNPTPVTGPIYHISNMWAN